MHKQQVEQLEQEQVEAELEQDELLEQELEQEQESLEPQEHTVAEVLDRGFWAGMTLYPDSKCTPQRAVDIIECYGNERIWINSAGDWGPSDPLSVPKCHVEMRRRELVGNPAANPLILGQLAEEAPGNRHRRDQLVQPVLGHPLGQLSPCRTRFDAAGPAGSVPGSRLHQVINNPHDEGIDEG